MRGSSVTKGIVLSRTNFGEADRILTVLTPDFGKLRLMAKGVRKEASKLAGGIELFSISHITFIKGKIEINTLISTRLIIHFGNISKNIERTMFGYEALKVINRATEDSTGGEYFTLAERTLEALDQPDLDLNLIRLWLYMQLLKLAGHSPNLRTDKTGRKLSEGKFAFDSDSMSFAAASGRV